MAVRRELRASRVHRRLRARRAVHRIQPLRGRRAIARAVPFVAVGATAAVLLSVAQMIQYWIGVLPMADTTWAQYRDLFLRFR